MFADSPSNPVARPIAIDHGTAKIQIQECCCWVSAAKLIMSANTGRRRKGLEYACGFLIALYLLVGRWTPYRLSTPENEPFLAQPRHWIVLLLLALASVVLTTSPSQSRPRRRRERVLSTLWLGLRGQDDADRALDTGLGFGTGQRIMKCSSCLSAA